MGQAHHRDAGAREAPAASGGEVGALPVAGRVPCGDVPCSPGWRDIPKPLSLTLFPSVIAGWNCCYKSLTKSRMVL